MMKRMWVAVLGAAATVAAPQLALAAPEPSRPVGIKLPDERLALVSGSPRGANFLAIDSTAWTGRSAVITMYTIFEPPSVIGENLTVVQGVDRQRIDCAAHTHQDLGSEGFDEGGKSIVWLPERPPEPIEANSSHAFMAKVICEKVELPASNMVQGHVAARTLALQLLRKKP